MIQAEDLSISFQGHALFTDATFNLQKGERCGFVGRNGSGKTTLFRLLTGEETADRGKILLPKNYTLGVLKQHIHFTEPTLLEEGALGLKENEKDHLYKVEAILFGLGFKEEDLYKSPHDFSGGYQLRIQLAKVLIAEPDCLLLDEPTNYLDIVSLRWLTRFLKHWKGEFILISHDREFMDATSTHTMGIHREKLRKMKGTSVEFFEKILQEEAIHEKTAQNVDKKRAHLQSFIDRFGAKATKAAQANARKKMLDRIPVLERLKELYNLNFEFTEAPFSGKKMVDAQEIEFGYIPNTDPLITDFSLSIEKGERVAIIGKNGRGKSTLIKLLANDLQPIQGNVKTSENVKIGYFGQTNIDRLHPSHTIEEEIGLANSRLNLTQIRSICGAMMFSGDKAQKPIKILSGGEKSRVLLGKILATPCNLLLLDEPTHHLDIESLEALIDALEDFEGSLVLVTHSELMLKRINFDRLIVCHHGRQDTFLGNYDDFIAKNGWHDESENSGKRKKTGTEREERKMRAESVVEKSKALKPLETAIANKEKELAKLEKSLKELHDALALAAEQNNGALVQKLSQENASLENAVNQNYEELEKLIVQREKLGID